MRILMLITGLGMGGAERQVVDLADQFVRQGHKLMIVALTGDAVIRPACSDIEVVSVGMRKTLVGFISAYARIAGLIRRFAPDVVHSHMVHANIMARLLRLVSPIPRLICTAHSKNEGGRLRMLAYRVTDSFADLSTNVSQEAADAFLELRASPVGKMIAVHNGIDTSRFMAVQSDRDKIREEYAIPEETLVLLAVGRLVPEKDYPNLLRAFALLSPGRGSCVLWIVGGGPLMPSIRAMAESLGIHKLVRFLGIRGDIPALMSAADIFVLSSKLEGFGLVVAEAMACERLVVATDAGGVKEVLGDCGWLVETGNSENLAAAISSAMSISRNEKNMLTTAARARVENNFALRAVAADWLRIYEGKFSERMESSGSAQ